MSKNKQQPLPQAPLSVNESSVAWKIFNAFVTDGQFNLSENDLRSYALNDLKLIDHYGYDKLPPGFMEHLPVILVAYMNMWSGWHFKGEFLAGKFQKEHYFQRFQKFMSHKMASLIRGQFLNAMKALGEQYDSTGRLCAGKKDQEFSPYAISISCPAHMLNTIVFSNNGEDVIMKQHLGAKWLDLTPVQLVNWPHVEVTFRTPDLYFMRRQATEFIRYLNFLPHESNKPNEYIIENTELFGQQECYSYDFLEKYIKLYLECLKTVTAVSASKLYEVQTILIQFLEDVRYLNINKSMATNTAVTFRLSPVPFIRNKKLMKNSDKEGDEARVGYCEIITPKILLLLGYFKAKQKDTSVLSFEYTDKIRNAGTSETEVIPQISYKCTFCKEEYGELNSRDLMLQHMKTEHKMEQHVRCTLCKKQFEVLSLAACRWRHKCQPAYAWSSQKSVN